MENQLLDEGILDQPTEQETLEYASGGKRFGNFLIDIILAYLFVIVGIVIIALLVPSSALLVADGGFISYLIIYSGIFLYFFMSEFFMKGRTIGKLITGTRAITVEGEYLSAGTAAARSLARFVPFEAFSFLGQHSSGWHDRWTSTMVVNESDFRERQKTF